MRFSNRLLGLIIALVIVSGLIQLFVLDRFILEDTSKLMLTTNEKAANNIQGQLSAYLNKLKDVMKIIAADPQVLNDKTVLDKINGVIPEINSFFILDKQGNILHVSGSGFDQGNFSQREYFQRAIHGETYISNIFTSAAGRQVIAISTPIMENGSVSGVLIGIIWLHENNLVSLFGNQTFGQDGIIVVTDRQGIVIYHSDKARIGQRAFVYDSLQGPAGSVTMKNYAGQEQYIGYSRVPESNWLVAVHTPTSEVKHFSTIMKYDILAATSIISLLLIAAGTYTLRRYMRPFEELVKAFSSIKKGVYTKIDPDGYAAEFDEMVHVYNDTVKRLEQVHVKLAGDAEIDSLTGTYNRRALDKTLKLLDDEMRAGTLATAGITLVDLDNFKNVNDKEGHLAGDEFLKKVTALVASIVGPRCLFRYGGDEFVVISRNIPRDTVISLAQEVRLQGEMILADSTISIGVATFPENAASSMELLALADRALYASKLEKNKVTASSPIPG